MRFSVNVDVGVEAPDEKAARYFVAAVLDVYEASGEKAPYQIYHGVEIGECRLKDFGVTGAKGIGR